jgi:hypothetical protein
MSNSRKITDTSVSKIRHRGCPNTYTTAHGKKIINGKMFLLE